MSLRTRDICEGMVMQLLWEYTSTDCTEHDSVCKAVYSENSLEFSILVKMLHIFGHNTGYVIYSGVCFAWRAEGQVSSIITRSSELHPQIHNICSCTQIVGEQTTTSYKKICTWVTIDWT